MGASDRTVSESKVEVTAWIWGWHSEFRGLLEHPISGQSFKSTGNLGIRLASEVGSEWSVGLNL